MIRNIYFTILLLSRVSLQSESDDYDFVYFDGIRSLSELPIRRLLELKNSFVPRIGTVNTPYDLDDIEGRMLFDDLQYSHPGQIHAMKRYEEWDEHKSKNSKITKIFNLTISALSLLAFGGYLITLLITAFRGNVNATIANPNVIVVSRNGRPKRDGLYYNDEYFYSSDKLYEGMILLSEDFAKLN